MQRFGLLHMAMPKKLTIKKIIILVNVLAWLHNFCIDELTEADDDTIPEELAVDTFNIINHADGYVELEDEVDGTLTNLPLALMHGGEHFHDVTKNECKKHQRRNSDELTPRRLLHNRVLNSHMKRPLPRKE